jgi:large subunit ribosomal protein L27
MGRDHTIFAMQPGFVQYYRDPIKHPKRQYIGVVFSKTQTLPTPLNAARRRRLGMVAIPRRDLSVEDDATEAMPAPTDGPAARGNKKLTTFEKARRERVANLKISSNYMYREANWEIGRTAEREGISAREYKRGDRWLAWRKANKRKAMVMEKRSLGGGKAAKKGKKRK